MRKRARISPPSATTWSSEVSQSAVSTSSMSGSCCLNSSEYMRGALRWAGPGRRRRPAGTVIHRPRAVPQSDRHRSATGVGRRWPGRSRTAAPGGLALAGAAVRSHDRARRGRRPERLRRPGRQPQRGRRVGRGGDPEPGDRPGPGRRRARRLHPGLASRRTPPTSPRTAASGRSIAWPARGARSSIRAWSSTGRPCARARTARTATRGSRCATRPPVRRSRPSWTSCSGRAACDRVVVGGLATDYCVRATALDAARLGYATSLLTDASRAVDLAPGDGDRAVTEMSDAGVAIVRESDR